MIKAYLIDDDLDEMRFLELLLSCMGVDIIGKSANPYRALEEIESMHPDVVFLEIGMQKLNGLQVAEMLNDMSLRCLIVFVTAFKKYAVDAFELQALDYVLKPIEEERIGRTIQRIRKKLKLSGERV